MTVAAVVIGRNEGARLVACLTSLRGAVDRIVYVDSGSTDGSADAARGFGAEVVELDMSRPFTAARARNAGLARLSDPVPPELVQFVDGDCEIRTGWIEAAAAFLRDRPEVGAVCGRLRERHPEASVWNRLMDEELDVPPGESRSCGGIAMFRHAAIDAVGGFDPDLIAGEEPELCVRLRQVGWTIWRLDTEMALHDAAMTRFAQWWRRCQRAGYTYAEGVAMHGRPPERHNVARLRRTLFWGLFLPLAAFGGALFTPWALALALLWPVQIARLRRRGMRWDSAMFLMIAKFAEVQGAAKWAWRRLRRAPARLIEYK